MPNDDRCTHETRMVVHCCACCTADDKAHKRREVLQIALHYATASMSPVIDDETREAAHRLLRSAFEALAPPEPSPKPISFDKGHDFLTMPFTEK